MILLRSWVVLLLLSCSSSVHAYTFGYTPNVAISGLEWTMTPTYLGANGIGGMDVSGVTYKYIPIKNKNDDYVVTLENDKVGGGYVFQDVQDWSQREGGIEVRRTIALPYTPIALFGDGRLKQEGTGSIEGADVKYIYRFDHCFDPQSDPSCPGYKKPPPPKLPDIPDYDALQDESVAIAQKETDRKLSKEDQAEKEEDEEEDEESLEFMLADVENAIAMANEIAQSVILQQLNNVTNLTNYYVSTIPDNYYPDAVALQGGTIVDNRRALRSLSQDARMNEMIEEQYK
jgi:hypothetical protein